MTTKNAPTSEKQRHMILDSLRGFALLGICLANLPEFGLWTFLDTEAQQSMATWETDHVVRWLQYFLVDAKFYGIFSILFGIGFSIILSHAAERGNSGIRLFYRRMTVLLIIGVLHLLLIWSGDILMLYALGGMLLPLVSRWSTRRLLWLAGLCLCIPVAIDLWQELTGISLSAPIVEAWWQTANSYGITEENFATWLRDARCYKEVHDFLIQGAVERMYEFVDGHRLLKVIGLFLIGYCMGRERLYARLEKIAPRLKQTLLYCLILGVPTSALYATSAIQGHAWGLTVHSLLYTVSTLPMTLAYMSGLCLLYMSDKNSLLLRACAKPGRMALSNYIGQSLLGIAIYYGIGFGLGLSMGLAQIELTAIGIFLLQIIVSTLWMHSFRFGPLEWLWRMATYGRWLRIRKGEN